MGSDESHFNVSVGSDGQSPQTTTFLKRKESRSGIERLGTRLLPQSYQYPNLSEGADRVGGQLRGDKD